MDSIQPNIGAAKVHKEEEQGPAGSLPSVSMPVLSYEGVNNATIPTSTATAPLQQLPLPSPTTWLNPLQWAGDIDLTTPKVEDIDPPVWTSAVPSSETPEVAFATLPPQNIMPLREPLPHPVKLLGSSAAPTVAGPTSRLQTQNLRNDGSFNSTPGQLPVIGLNHTGVRSTQSAANMDIAYGDLPQRPQSSDGLKKRTTSRRRNTKGAHSANVSIASLGDTTGDDENEDEKLRISRERNRIAAAKTRRKKKSKAKEIEETAKEVEERNRLLHQEVRSLRDAFSTLRYCALTHDPAEGCTCSGIHQYNQAMAKEVAKDVAEGKI